MCLGKFGLFAGMDKSLKLIRETQSVPSTSSLGPQMARLKQWGTLNVCCLRQLILRRVRSLIAVGLATQEPRERKHLTY